MSSQSIDGVTSQFPLYRTASSIASSQRRPADAGASEESGAAPQAESTDQQLQQAVRDLQDAITPLAAELRFSVDEETGRTVVKVLDTATGKVLKQFPSEEILQISQSIETFQQGWLVDKQV